ncbi:TraM recognition domain-containing protein [Gaoshiqia hydrogeniformans]|uniref:TraM recognition domain-containing protein n=1 Tax=Gaoshiqia hydrogeniformans TaxID=3290090 RepID=UPI003D768236
MIIDELPTSYFRELDNLIATARSNKVSVCQGFQDYSQLPHDYGDKESKVIQNTVGNIFSGQVVGETARALSERFWQNPAKAPMYCPNSASFHQ